MARWKNINFYEEVGVETTDFNDCYVNWNFNSVGFSLDVESYDSHDIIEYSFNGNTVHGCLIPQSVRQGVMWDNRVQNKVWLRRRFDPDSNLPIIVRIEAWRFDS